MQSNALVTYVRDYRGHRRMRCGTLQADLENLHAKKAVACQMNDEMDYRGAFLNDVSFIDCFLILIEFV